MNTRPDQDRTISINCDNFREALAESIVRLAAKRCRQMLMGRAKKENDAQDNDYDPDAKMAN
jgi:predicted RNA-binding protein Jag